MRKLVPLFFVCLLFGASGFVNAPVQPGTEDYWIRFCNEDYECGYVNSKGDTMIPARKYLLCETDTFRNYAKVLQPHGNWIAIDKSEKVLYQIHTFDNGPDYAQEGLFRIWKNGKMGYADERTGKIILYPQFSCGFPFDNGVAKVTYKCNESEPDGEGHRTWSSEEWFYIDHAGSKVDSPK
jgi:hypothetical protein